MSQLLADQSTALPEMVPPAPVEKRNTLLQDCIAGFKANIIPGLIIQAIAMIVVLSYYFIPWVNQNLSDLGDFKSRHSILYTIVSVNIFCTVIPMIVMAFMGRLGHVAWWKQLIFYLILFTEKGLEAHFLYTGLEWLVSGMNVPAFVKVLIKSGIDQFGYTAFYAAWNIAFWFMLKDMNFDVKAWWKSLDRKFWFHTSPVTLVSSWTVWIPGTLLIYAMPLPLQIPLNNLLSCFFVLVLAVLSHRSANAREKTA